MIFIKNSRRKYMNMNKQSHEIFCILTVEKTMKIIIKVIVKLSFEFFFWGGRGLRISPINYNYSLEGASFPISLPSSLGASSRTSFGVRIGPKWPYRNRANALRTQRICAYASGFF